VNGISVKYVSLNRDFFIRGKLITVTMVIEIGKLLCFIFLEMSATSIDNGWRQHSRGFSRYQMSALPFRLSL
jgi:hypothetical protein